MKPRVLVTDRLELNTEVWLRTQAEVVKSASPRPTPDELKEPVALLIRSRTTINEELLQQAPQLKVIVTATSGFDHIDLQATTRAGIAVMHTPEGNSQSAAELTWALTLACARRLMSARRMIQAGTWDRQHLVGSELAEKSYGVIGLGRIGLKVAKIAQAFDMRVMAYDPYAPDHHFAGGIERVGLEELLRQAQVVSLHVPKTSETHHLIARGTLEFVQPELILINTSRGTAVNEDDLLAALDQNRLGAVGMDVFNKEPLPRSSRLLSHEKVVLTPHIGATTHEAFARSSQAAAQKIMAFLKDGALSDPLPPPAPWYKDC